MKRFFKTVVFIFLFLTCFAITPKKIFAQGTYNCRWYPWILTGSKCLSLFAGSDKKCEDGFKTQCFNFHNKELCENIDHPCVPEDQIQEKDAEVNSSCVTEKGGSGVSTAIGCIPTNDLNGFAGWILGRFIFIASGIAFLLMSFGAFQIIASAGDPKKVQAGKELITSALSGLLFIILSIFLLKLIGVDILKIPGLGEQTLY